ncbi:MAG: hypothetical protein AB8B86_06755 [Pseudomonadales bacterium]
MSLLLDALNKTSASPEPANDDNAADVSDQLSTEFQNTDAPKSRNLDRDVLELEADTSFDESAEQDVGSDLTLDESELERLVNDHPADRDLENAVDDAAESAMLDAHEKSVEDSLDEVAAEITAIDSELEQATPTSHNPAEETTQSERGFLDVDEEPESQEVSDADFIEGDGALKQTINPAETNNSGITIDAEVEPESLAEEILHDAPLIAAYAKAQRKRKVIISSMLGLVALAAIAVVFKAFIFGPKPAMDTSNLDPGLEQMSDNVGSIVELEEVSLSLIPARKVLLNFGEADLSNHVSVTPAPANSKELNSAYTALQSGQLDKAAVLYQRLSENKLTRADALAGLSSIAMTRGDLEKARYSLQELLTIDKTNTYALAAIAALPPGPDATGADSENKISVLKSLQHANPNNAEIAYMLGNQLASESQWARAQAAYFKAYTNSSSNAAYSLNLAIALDQLGKSAMAREYYTIALQHAAKSNPLVDVNAIKRRLAQGK